MRAEYRADARRAESRARDLATVRRAREQRFAQQRALNAQNWRKS